ncbi:MAG: aminopeptidase [Salinivirgaceae bacterium]|jgi:bleomycin hydrolase|nr:aminopeptidase [Salinivirgaceae bacterium]
MKHFTLSLVFLIIALSQPIFGQSEKDTEYNFEVVKEVPHTATKNQGQAGTCWSYATVSFFESELMRLHNKEIDLSELFFVYHAYINKAERYVMRHGLSNFSQGGQAHDVTDVIRKYGMITEDAYTGKTYDGELHNHFEMEAMLKGMLDGLIDQPQKMPQWKEAFKAVLDVYLGSIPETFTFDEKEVSTTEFRDNMNINPEDYIEFTSYLNYPMHSDVILDIPDNWSFDKYYNVPLDELMAIINNAIDNDYTVVWDGDVSEAGFNHSEGVAVVPTEEALEEDVYKNQIAEEKEITPEVREEMFMSQQSTDDHLMHLIGTSKDSLGNMYYIIKNSWDADSNEFEGKLFMSVPYARAHTVAIMVHKDAVPKSLLKKIK